MKNLSPEKKNIYPSLYKTMNPSLDSKSKTMIFQKHSFFLLFFNCLLSDPGFIIFYEILEVNQFLFFSKKQFLMYFKFYENIITYLYVLLGKI